MNQSDRNPMISLTNAGASQGDKWLVRGVGLSISRGEIVTLIGPNGSGKSTTAKMALGLRKPNEGLIERLENLQIGYVPQKIHIDWTVPLSCERMMQLTSRISENEMINALEKTGIPHLRKQAVHHLSGGEFQRLLLARAIARKPDILVLDEPVQGVDYAGEIALYNLITSIRDDLNCGVLLISHDLHVVMAKTDQVICLNGHVCCQGTPQKVIETDAYKQLFGTKSSEALAFYQHDHDHTHLPDGRVVHNPKVNGGTDDHHCTKDHKHVG